MPSQKRRIYLDLEVSIADAAKERAYQARVATKRYIEALIEKDCNLNNGKEAKKPKPAKQ